MTQILTPGQFKRSKIVTETRKGQAILNEQSFDSTHWSELDLKDHILRHPRAHFRTGVIPVYNCHGLTFASRRTSISESTEIKKILSDDHYEEVFPNEVQPGDIILYVSSEDGDVEHSGIVVESPDPPLFVPKVLSKWGFGAEVIHWANNSPYDFSQAKYYRIRS